MKTIQEYLKNCNRKEIINMYIYKYAFTPELIDKKYQNITCGEIIKKYTEILNNYIDKLISIKPNFDNDEVWILLSTHSYGEFDDNIQHLLIKKSDLLSKDDLESVESYAYNLSPFEEILSYYVADTYLTQYEINDLLVDFLHESSWTGFEQENLKQTVEDLEESLREIDENKENPKTLYSAEEVFKQLEEEYGFEPEKKDEKQENAYKKFLKNIMEYEKECKNIELKKLKDLLIV